MNKKTIQQLLELTIEASIEAGKEILDVYDNAFEVEYKDDKSPLTLADKRAHNKIVSFLERTAYPILSEEGKHESYDSRKDWNSLWIVDPLDGTKEFVKRNGEFTVNIALIQNSSPHLGVIYVPVEDTLYYGALNFGAFKVQNASKLNFKDAQELDKNSIELPEKQPSRAFTMVGSRSHMSDETQSFYDKLKTDHPDAQILSKGSSLKICMVAEGSADVYPRFAPTMEWDTAAGHAIANAAGCSVLMHNSENSELEYNKQDLLNPWFIVKKNNK